MSNLYHELVTFCNYCFAHGQIILLQIFKTDDKLYQQIEAVGYEYEKEYIIFKTNTQEEFLIMLAATNTYLRTKPNNSIVDYIEFPRERDWGKKIIFEIIDKVHGHHIIFSIGVNNESFLQEYIEQYLT